MVEQIGIEQFFKLSEDLPLIDVRSPKEFEHAHIPGAVNLPLFSNDERAEVGISYKNGGRQEAILLGLKFVGPKMTFFAHEVLRIAVDNQVVVHCWRGGMRSSNMAWLFSTLGIKTYVLEGGYKTYRRYLKQQFASESQLVVLGGMTGSGKTEILKELAKEGHQVVDLEGLANHKGSAFGSFGQKPQPSTEQFENNLFECWKTFNFSHPIWIEDESKTIGKVGVPDELFARIRNSKVVVVEIPYEKRLNYLLDEYGRFSQDELKNAINKIKKRLDGKKFKTAIGAIEQGDNEPAARIALDYYDKAYRYGLSKRKQEMVHTIRLNSLNHSNNAKELLKFYATLNS
jgi:tRNA 2-selenouridine synthase